MDLGSKICKAKNPICSICPLNKICKTFKYNKLILSSINKNKLRRKNDNKLFFVRRSNKGLLGGMLSFPSSLWVTDKNNIPNNKLYKNLIENEKIKNYVQHTFSHFKLILNIYEINIRSKIDIEGEWINLDDALEQLPSLMKKVANIL